MVSIGRIEILLIGDCYFLGARATPQGLKRSRGTVQDHSLLSCFKAGLHRMLPRASRKWVIFEKFATRSGHPPSLIHQPSSRSGLGIS
jgi:hypothetical protein